MINSTDFIAAMIKFSIATREFTSDRFYAK